MSVMNCVADHLASFGCGYAEGLLLGTLDVTLKVTPEITSVKDRSGWVISSNQPFARSIGKGVGIGTTIVAVFNWASSKPETPPATPEKPATTIEQQKPAPTQPQGSTVYHSASGPVVIPKGLKIA